MIGVSGRFEGKAERAQSWSRSRERSCLLSRAGGIPLFHEVAKDDEATGAELAVTRNNLGALMGATK